MSKRSKKKALIFGVTGQDGSYLSEFLLNKNYIVHGVKRKSSSFNTDRINHIFNNKNFLDNNSFALFNFFLSNKIFNPVINVKTLALIINPNEI